MEDNIFDQVRPVDLKETMENSYIDYAMSVIASRALPDVRDGLKPVQRRILYAMIELSNTPDKPHRKCARIVGDTMGKYHPHGDSSIYGSLVNLAQEWSTHYPLVDGHGNFGSVDGDGAAAMRYTEARLSKIAMEMLADINKNTVEFIPNFDETEKEPTVLPSRVPNLLINGTTGIAVGMATNIPPHNIGEIIDAVALIINNRINEGRETSIDEILQIVKGPDFPTGGTILGTRGINEAYRTGRGKIRIRAVTDIEPMANGKNRIVVTELPFLVNKARLIAKIAELVKDKKIDGITDLRDESDRQGMRVCIELRRDVNPQVVLNHLYKHTQLQDTFGVNMLALVDNEPKMLSILQILELYIKHQEDVVTRRTKFDLNKAEELAHIKEGLLKALDIIDEIIALIRASKSTPEAKQGLIDRFGFDDPQAQAIVDMRLRQLTGLEREKLEAEYAELMEKIKEYKAILGDENILLTVVRDEAAAIGNKYRDERKTSIGFDDDISAEDLVPDDDTVIAMTRLGYIKRMTPDNFKAQHRGGKGIKGMSIIDDDFIEELFMTTNHHFILFFTNQGRVYRLKAYEIPEASRTSRGTAIVNLLQLQPDEHVSATITVRGFDFDSYLLMATKGGIIKTTRLSEYANIRKVGLIAITLRDGDELIGVKCTDEKQDVMLITKKGMSIRFNETDVRVTGRQSIGVIGINLDDDDEVVAMQLTEQGKYLLTVSELGFGKLTPLTEFNSQHRAGKGVHCYKIMDKSGPLVGAKILDTDNDIIIITNAGTVIRLQLSDVRICGRTTTGVKLINLVADKNTKVARIARVRETEEDAETNAGMSGEVLTAVPLDDDEEEDSEEEKATLHSDEFGGDVGSDEPGEE
ncbi:MAG: DNA gyrase subunit A [Lachnospiraceae bacterium]|nr:DNA gyrase subunit A [Lachnospiraceae bacterium]MBR5733187.1 DNA gyrase subunit A [Lachnospiraceae bacterium]